MTDLFQEPEDATPLTPDECEGLRLTWVTTRADLNVAEQDNIDKGAAWAYRARKPDLLTVEYVLKLHKRMFGDVWLWAGRYRRSERNIGIAPHMIGVQTGQLMGDAAYWVEHRTYEPTELAVRVHHRLVFIHPFPNGNGRHARMMADLVLRRLGEPALSWGGGSLSDITELRRAYVDALRRADREDYDALIAFSRS
ncbi:MAG: mobile mystery protein B [Hyphomonas sp.]|uniref:mobile mystery protein B n=1 Tax=Hyphomonas sp. TaxID=87 RepID=UPI00181AB5CE|nr:mobile mystery protein B [Hyphomonas sp.]MBA3067436.1 mobile mystery protein B [Hyphomonas sp.]MBU3922476.1 mobile mystery protein B [Alphaproteobacteria bacterium]MBU4061012.1 mobile mystery protein B [Alphaproteobacteria bacterium]MBU4165868.1 mobile mystery protein B [Alphaproteobacteria bacterium]